MLTRALGSFILLLFAACVCPGCGLRVEEQNALLLMHPDTDSADFIVSYIGLDTIEDKPKKEELEAVRMAVAGRRLIGIMGLGFWDLDDTETGEKDTAPLRALGARIQLKNHGMYIGERGRLCGFQHLVLAGVKDAMVELNQAISQSVLHWDSAGTLDKELPLFGDPTRSLWVSRAKSGEPWIAQDGDDLILDFPITAEEWMVILGKLAESRMKDRKDRQVDQLEFWEQMLGHVCGLDLKEDHVRIRLGLQAKHGFRYRYVAQQEADPKERYQGRLLGYLVGSGELKFMPPEEVEKSIPRWMR